MNSHLFSQKYESITFKYDNKLWLLKLSSAGWPGYKDKYFLSSNDFSSSNGNKRCNGRHIPINIIDNNSSLRLKYKLEKTLNLYDKLMLFSSLYGKSVYVDKRIDRIFETLSGLTTDEILLLNYKQEHTNYQLI